MGYYRGDFIGSVRKGLKKVSTFGRKTAAVINNPIGSAVGGLSRAFGGSRTQTRKDQIDINLPYFGPGSQGRRHRRLDVTNVKALRRAIRRAKGFEKLARKVISFTSPGKAKGRGHFKTARKRAS